MEDIWILGSGDVHDVGGFDPTEFIDANRLRRMDSLSAMAVVAAHRAARSASLDLDRSRLSVDTGVAFGTAYGCQDTELRYAQKLVERGGYFTNPIDFPDSIDGACAAHVAMELGLGGPSVTHADGALSDSSALVHAVLALRMGRAKRMLVGAGDTMPPLLQAIAANCRVATGERAGASFLVLETMAGAMQRGAQPLARVAAIAQGADGKTRVGRRPSQSHVEEEVVRRSIEQAGVPARDVESRPLSLRALGKAAMELSGGDVRVTLHHATAPGGQSVALVLTRS